MSSGDDEHDHRFESSVVDSASLARWAEAEREYHNLEADNYIRRVEHAYVFQLPDAYLLFRNVPLGGLRPRVILDVGCGPALSIRASLLARLGPADQYVGIDIADRLLLAAKANVPGGIFIREDLQQLRLRPGTVDFVVALGALHHAPDPEKALHELVTALRPGGYLLMREPTDRAFTRGQGESPAESGLDVDRVHEILTQLGCVIEDERYLTSWLFVKLRHLLERAGLQGWERWRLAWEVKMRVGLILDRFVGRRAPHLLRGLDVYLVARKLGVGPGGPFAAGTFELSDAIACRRCGSELQRPQGSFGSYACARGCELQLSVGPDGIWIFSKD